MDKKQIQKERMMGYFLEAAKKIIREEGMEGVSVRKVADAAGYSYATIYNYFKDVNELLWYVAVDFIHEIERELEEYDNPGLSGVERMKQLYSVYTGYYLKNPSVYELMFFSKLGQPPREIEKVLTEPVLGDKLSQVLIQCTREESIEKSEVPVLREIITFVVHGLLLFYFSGKGQVAREDLTEKFNTYVDYLTGG